jgi:hypothetical protein
MFPYDWISFKNPFIFLLVIAYILLQLFILWELMNNKGMEAVLRLTWVTIVIFVPIGGIVLYFLYFRGTQGGEIKIAEPKHSHPEPATQGP